MMEPPRYGAEWKEAPVHPCRHVGPALALFQTPPRSSGMLELLRAVAL